MVSSSPRTSARVLRLGISVVAVTGLLIGAARAQVDRDWLADALEHPSRAGGPWEADAAQEEPGTAQGSASPVGEEADDARAPSPGPSSEPAPSPSSLESVVQSADALPYPWDDRVEVRSELVDPWKDQDTPWVNPEKHVLEDKFVQRAAPPTPWTDPKKHLFEDQYCRRHVPLRPWDDQSRSKDEARSTEATSKQVPSAEPATQPEVTEEDVWDQLDPGPESTERSRADQAWDLERPWLRK